MTSPPDTTHNVPVDVPSDQRVDRYLGTTVHVVGSRQARPNLPTLGCPFCPGGIEAPEPYDVRWFANRWPAMPDERCEVLLYSPQHDASLWSLGVAGVAKVIDLWAERTAHLGARADVDFVLVFENRGADVGATIAHPHGQVYAYDHIPERPRRIFDNDWRPDLDPGDRAVATSGGWSAFVPYAPTFPVAVTLAPTQRAPDIVSLDEEQRRDLATLLVDVFARLDRLYDRPLPYMMWLMQRPTVADAATRHPQAWMHIEVVSPWRSAGVSRFIAAAEVACAEYFNPVLPEDLAARLRRLG